MMRRRFMIPQGEDIKGKVEAVAGDILCAKADGSRMVVKAANYASIPSGWTAIGVVVIPPSHDVYGTGEGAAVSLRYMDYNNPDSGNTDGVGMVYGQRNNDTSLLNYTYVLSNINNSGNSSDVGAETTGYLPSDIFTFAQSMLDPKAYYYSTLSSYKYCFSPYTNNDSKSEFYLAYSELPNSFSDVDGATNTATLTSLTSQSDWKTASVLTNAGIGYSTAACCCWRYHTVGTNQGDWYLPAMGELGYLMVRLKNIKQSLKNIGSNIGADTAGTSCLLWSSSEISSTNARGLELKDGMVTETTKHSSLYVRPFLRF